MPCCRCCCCRCCCRCRCWCCPQGTCWPLRQHQQQLLVIFILVICTCLPSWRLLSCSTCLSGRRDAACCVCTWPRSSCGLFPPAAPSLAARWVGWRQAGSQATTTTICCRCSCCGWCAVWQLPASGTWTPARPCTTTTCCCCCCSSSCCSYRVCYGRDRRNPRLQASTMRMLPGDPATRGRVTSLTSSCCCC